MADLNSTQVLSQFDRLQHDGELFYSPATPMRDKVGNLDLEYRIAPSFAAKPKLAQPGSKTKTAQSSHRPPPTDGSDIDHSDPAFFVSYVASSRPTQEQTPSQTQERTPHEVPHERTTAPHSPHAQETHKLILNKFCVVRPQYLLLTTDASKRQTDRLEEGDLVAAWSVLEQLREPRECYVIYNGGREAGSSRNHKHMQVLECPVEGEGDRGLVWPGMDVLGVAGEKSDVAEDPARRLPLPYLAYYQRLAGEEYVMKTLLVAYEKHIQACEKALENEESATRGHVPHNVILTRDFLITIPRRATTVEGIEGHLVGAQGMLGLVWCNNEAQMKGWQSTGPVEVLRGLGVPSS